MTDLIVARMKSGSQQDRAKRDRDRDGDRSALLCYWAEAPPSTAMVCPVTKEAASEHSHTTASATSSGFPLRPAGSAIIICSSTGRWCVTRSTIGVWITPGHTAFTRTPDLAYSNAAVLVSPTTPCLLAT